MEATYGASTSSSMQHGPDSTQHPSPMQPLHNLSASDFDCLFPSYDLSSLQDPLDFDALMDPHSSGPPFPPPNHAPSPTAPPPPPSHPPATPPAINSHIDALLDDPLNAALVTAQLARTPQPRARKAPPIAKPRQKIRPKDQLNALQKHLETVVDQVKHLTLRNRQLSRRKHALEQFVHSLSEIETHTQQILADLAHHRDHPADPPRGAAAFKDMTPHQFIAFYKGQLGAGSKWVLQADAAIAAGRPPPEEAVRALAGDQARIMEVVMYVCAREGAFIPRVMAEMLKLFPRAAAEEEHWGEVLELMELQQGQVEEILVARDVFLNCMDRLEREQEVVQAHIHQGAEQAAGAASFDAVLNMEEDLLGHITANLRKNTNLAVLLAMHVFQRILNPLQVAKCALHALPLFPDPIIVMNAIHAKYGQAPAGPLLAPPTRHAALASARTLSATVGLYPDLDSTGPPTSPPVVSHASAMDAHPTMVPPAGSSGGGYSAGSTSTGSITTSTS